MKLKIIFVLIVLYSCNSNEGTTITWKNYCLNGKVKLISDRFVLKPQNIEEMADTFQNKITTIQNRHFDENGNLFKVEYFNKDSLLLLEVKHLFSRNGKIIGSEIYKNGEKTEKVKIKKTGELVETKSYNVETNKLNSTTNTEYLNGFSYRQVTEYYESERKMSQEIIYLRNEKGLETEIQNNIKINEEVISYIVSINYLELDNLGNWIRRDECTLDGNNDCKLVIRQIFYYIKIFV